MASKLLSRTLYPVGLLAVALAAQPGGAATIDPTCVDSNAPLVKTGTELNDFTPVKSGVIFDAGTATLTVQKTTAFQGTQSAGVTDTFIYACAGDFDGDGWTDIFATGDSADGFVRWYKNTTYTRPAPGCTVGGTASQPDCATANWNGNPPPIRQAQFTRTPAVGGFDTRAATGTNPTRGGIACGDINRDNRPDALLLVCATGGSNNCSSLSVEVWLNTGNAATPFNATSTYNYQPFSSLPASLQYGTWSHQPQLQDMDGDGWRDLVWGAGTNGGGGQLKWYKNNGCVSAPCAVGTKPMFNTTSHELLGTDAGWGYAGPTTLAFGNIDADTATEMVVGGQSSNRLRIYELPVNAASFITVPYTGGTYPGGAGTVTIANNGGSTTTPGLGGITTLFLEDFTLDGKIDMVTGTDNFNYPNTAPNSPNASQHTGGQAFLFVNNGGPAPFSGGINQVLATHQEGHVAGNRFDFDLGLTMDYDHDPQNTKDVVIADGNHSSAFYLLPVRQANFWSGCGTVDSDVLPLGGLATEEIAVTTVRLDPSPDYPSEPSTQASVTWFASNDNGNSWTQASTCSSPAGTTDKCVTFSSTTGNQIKWRASLCPSDAGNAAPAVSGVSASFSYVTATNHYRSGPIVRDGIIYIGAFREPGAQGKFFAVNDDTGATRWEASDELDALGDGPRRMFTSTTTGVKVAWETGSSSSSVLQGLTGASAAQLVQLIGWQRSARFGLQTPLHRLGAIENSTPALMDAPTRPYWYGLGVTTSGERTLIDSYVSANAQREHLVFFAARDGALHAVYTNPADASDPLNGREVWAYVPPYVAQGLMNDCTQASTASPKVCAATNAQGNPLVYPDGAPTLASAKVNGTWRTILVAGQGNGGKAVYALDVTDTIDVTAGVITAVPGPTPLWSFNDINMGRTHSKPTIVRVKEASSGNERYLAVFASGNGFPSDVGDTVYAVDLNTGALVWKFDLGDTNTYISTDIIGIETDDELEDGDPKKDGYVDLIIFADNKGRVWKLDPGKFAGTAILPVGSSVALTINGVALEALFSTALTAGTIEGENRPIAGGMAIKEGADGRLVLFFGTGGTDDTPETEQNAFYAIYVDTGEIKNSLTPAVGVKFYGGVATNDDGQLIFNTSDIDESSSLGLCAPSVGTIAVYNSETFAEEFTIDAGGRLVAPVFISGGSFYTVNLKGELVTSQPGSGTTTGGGGTGGGGTGGGGTGSPGTVEGAMEVLTWRQVY